MRVLKAGLLNFPFVFGAGFVLGSLRIFWVIPRLGARTAELLETPAADIRLDGAMDRSEPRRAVHNVGQAAYGGYRDWLNDARGIHICPVA